MCVEEKLKLQWNIKWRSYPYNIFFLTQLIFHLNIQHIYCLEWEFTNFQNQLVIISIYCNGTQLSVHWICKTCLRLKLLKLLKISGIHILDSKCPVLSSKVTNSPLKSVYKAYHKKRVKCEFFHLIQFQGKIYMFLKNNAQLGCFVHSNFP